MFVDNIRYMKYSRFWCILLTSNNHPRVFVFIEIESQTTIVPTATTPKTNRLQYRNWWQSDCYKCGGV